MSLGNAASGGVGVPSGSAQAAEEEETMIRKLIHDNSPQSSKRLFVFITLGLLGGLFAILIVSLSSRSDVFFTEQEIDLREISGYKNFTIDLSWCNTVPDPRKKIYVYFGPDSNPVDHHVLVQKSYSPSQLSNKPVDRGTIESECAPLSKFSDFRKLFGESVNRPLRVDPVGRLTSGSTFGDDELIVPCGLRSLFTLMPTVKAFKLVNKSWTEEAINNSTLLSTSGEDMRLESKSFNLLNDTNSVYFSKAQVGTMRNSRKLIGYLECNKMVSEATNMTITVSVQHLDRLFFRSDLFDKKYTLGLLNSPEKSYVQSYFISISVAIICLISVVFLLVITKLETAIF